MLKRFLATAAAVVTAGAISFAAQISTFSGPYEASQGQAYLNTLVGSINTSVGVIGSSTVSVNSSATTAEETLLSYTLPPATLAAAGQAIRATCWGGTATNADNKTMKLYFGSSSVSTATAATSNKGWFLDAVVIRKTASTQGFLGRGVVDTTAVSPATADGSETLANGILIKCTSTTAGTASDVTARGLLVEGIR